MVMSQKFVFKVLPPRFAVDFMMIKRACVHYKEIDDVIQPPIEIRMLSS